MDEQVDNHQRLKEIIGEENENGEDATPNNNRGKYYESQEK